jgi:hypothetical protein
MLPVAIGDHVVRDREQPGAEGRHPRSRQGVEGPRKDLLRRVRSCFTVINAAKAVAINGVEIGAIERGEGGRVALGGDNQQRLG